MGTFENGLDDLKTRIDALPSLGDPPPSSIDESPVRASLEHAWGTELLLCLTDLYNFDSEIVHIANNWAIVQTYYVAYHAVQALAVAKGYSRPDNHPKTQNSSLTFGSIDLRTSALGHSRKCGADT